MAVTKQFLSGSTNGRQIKTVAIATPGTLIHTADATLKDEIFLWATNSDTIDRKITVEFGGTTVPDDTVEITIPAESGPILVIPGFVLSASLVVRVWAAAANVVLIGGYVNRM